MSTTKTITDNSQESTKIIPELYPLPATVFSHPLVNLPKRSFLIYETNKKMHFFFFAATNAHIENRTGNVTWKIKSS